MGNESTYLEVTRSMHENHMTKYLVAIKFTAFEWYQIQEKDLAPIVIICSMIKEESKLLV